MAEPLAGVLSPAMMGEFSCGAVQAVISAVQRADFPVVYHNCGRLAPAAYPMLADLGAAAYHFGNRHPDGGRAGRHAARRPRDGQCGPRRGPDQRHARARARGDARPDGRVRQGGELPPLHGCDVPYAAPWENVEAFFAAVEEAQA